MRLLWLLALCVAAITAGAQGIVANSPWSSVGGDAVALSVGPDGMVMAAGRDGSLWTWRSADSSWMPIGGEGVRIAAAGGGRYFAVRRDGELVYFDGLRAVPLGLRALDVAIDRGGFPYALRSDGALVRKAALVGDWEVLSAPNARRLALSNDGAAWMVLADGKVARWENGKIEPVAGSGRSISSRADIVLLVDGNGSVQRWSSFNRTWEPEPAPPDLSLYLIDAANTPWAATADGVVYTRTTLQRKNVRFELASTSGSITFGKRTIRSNSSAGAARAIRGASYVAITPAVQTTDPAPIEWIDTLANAASIAIAPRDGSIFALDSAGNIGRWSNQRRTLTAYPGQFAKISVDADGLLWGVNLLGRVFRRDASLWHQINGNASDIAIGLKGEVFATSSTGVITKYDRSTDSLQLVPGTLFSPTVAPDGVPWGLLSDGTVVRCPTASCQRFTRTARSIAVGPDNSVFIVTLDGVLQKLRPTLDDWDIIPVLGQKVRSVAVGPRGRPWVVAESGRIYASAFFPRDESTDLLEASTTPKDTTGSGSTGSVIFGSTESSFVNVKNLQFQAIPVPSGYSGISLGPDGTVLMFYMSTQIIRYDNNKKAFVDVTGFPSGNIKHAKFGPDGKLWIISADVDGKIYHQIAGNTYETLQLPIPSPINPSPGSMNRSINISPDGSVYAIDTAGTLYWRPAGTTTFSKLINGTFQNVAIPRSGDVWVLDNSNVVRQIVNGVAQQRPANRAFVADDIAGGQDGTVYITTQFGGIDYPAKWNANNLTWDQVNRTANYVGVAPDGRPWIFDSDNPAFIYRAK